MVPQIVIAILQRTESRLGVIQVPVRFYVRRPQRSRRADGNESPRITIPPIRRCPE